MEVFILLTLLVIIVLFAIKQIPDVKNLKSLPYFKVTALLTPAEISFHHVLKLAVSSEYDIHAKVRLADVINVHKGIPKSSWRTAFNRIQSKHLDFVLVDKQTAEIICAIELDDASHANSSRQARDKFLEEVMTVAKLPLLRLPARQGYQSQDIQAQLTQLIMPGNLNPIVDEPNDNNLKVYLRPELDGEMSEVPTSCPKCGGNLLARKAMKGKGTGKTFLGCSNYPKCRYIAAN
ncbi:DUF2726 domain-containing protein [Methylophaga sp. OBS3]|uniref:DUF2726 domain-containing protein n=1 Tax=Methylophaga sp. OBS3 TaxID=2991934 RepID=UPI002255C53A|nr:DUF2726 domain-containing protein [Methylophaga sp. OBS3]MCX4189423.1 DUF2726 domain-containing protein [Methylophaga sp. OBS3]